MSEGREGTRLRKSEGVWRANEKKSALEGIARYCLLVSATGCLLSPPVHALPRSRDAGENAGFARYAHLEKSRLPVGAEKSETAVKVVQTEPRPAEPKEEGGTNFLLPHAHGSCLGWQPLLLWMHIGSDALIALSYYSMPIALFMFVRRRKDLQFKWLFVAFAIFILACGTTHIMGIWTLWEPVYMSSGLIKAFTALVSVLTAIVLWFLIPKALALPGPAQWEAVHDKLREEISERREAEEDVRRLNAELERKVEERTRQLRETQEDAMRKEKLAILGQLSGSVGHELRNPLGIMSNAVYFLKMVLSGADETTREYLGIIENEVNNSERIITDLLDFARTKPPQPQPVAVSDLLKQSLGKCNIPENVTVTLDIPEGLPMLKVDPLQMGQVLLNLITNGVQAMPDGGALRVVAQRVGVIHESPLQNTKQETGNFIEISVEDTGEGITQENMKKLFQPLFTTKPKGIGLGLVVCKNLVEANGRRIEVESEVGKGTTFRVVLPVVVVET